MSKHKDAHVTTQQVRRSSVTDKSRVLETTTTTIYIPKGSTLGNLLAALLYVRKDIEAPHNAKVRFNPFRRRVYVVFTVVVADKYEEYTAPREVEAFVKAEEGE